MAIFRSLFTRTVLWWGFCEVNPQWGFLSVCGILHVTHTHHFSVSDTIPFHFLETELGDKFLPWLSLQCELNLLGTTSCAQIHYGDWLVKWSTCFQSGADIRNINQWLNFFFSLVSIKSWPFHPADACHIPLSSPQTFDLLTGCTVNPMSRHFHSLLLFKWKQLPMKIKLGKIYCKEENNLNAAIISKWKHTSALFTTRHSEYFS